MYLILCDLYSNQTNTYTTCRTPHKATSSLCLEKNWYCWQPYTRVFSVKRKKDTQAVHSLTVQTHLKTSADCSRSGKCFAVVIWKVWRNSDRTNANRSCGNLRCMWGRLLWWRDWPRSNPLLACSHPNNCFEICRYIMCLITTVIITLLTGVLETTLQFSQRLESAWV